MTGPSKKSLMRSLGEFAGHVWHSIRTPVEDGRREIRREVEEHSHEAPGGRVTVRRTTIEEVEYERGEAGSSDRHET